MARLVRDLGVEIFIDDLVDRLRQAGCDVAIELGGVPLDQGVLAGQEQLPAFTRLLTRLVEVDCVDRPQTHHLLAPGARHRPAEHPGLPGAAVGHREPKVPAVAVHAVGGDAPHLAPFQLVNRHSRYPAPVPPLYTASISLWCKTLHLSRKRPETSRNAQERPDIKRASKTGIFAAPMQFAEHTQHEGYLMF